MPEPKEIARRLKTIRRNLKQSGLDAYLILDRANTLYASGLRCSSSYILLTVDAAFFLTDFRYLEIAKQSIPEFSVLLQKKPVADIARLARREKVRRIGFETSLPFGMMTQFHESFEDCEFMATDAPLTDARIRKSKAEIETIRKSVLLADAAYHDLAEDVGEGMSETQVRNRLRRLIERHGGEKESFDSIVAAGANASRPHAVPGERLLKRGDVVQIDTGLIHEDYCSDLSRVLSVGRPSEKLKKIYQVVVDAQKRAIEAIRPGARACDIDARARDHITKKGYGKNFGHGTGHGVGLEIHEPPTLRASSIDVLEEGMVVTVEPGIYIPGWGGVRIEDMIVVTRDGYEDLTTAAKRIWVV